MIAFSNIAYNKAIHRKKSKALLSHNHDRFTPHLAFTHQKLQRVISIFWSTLNLAQTLSALSMPFDNTCKFLAENFSVDIAHRIDAMTDKRSQSYVAASAILAGLLLEKEIIHRVLRRDIMRESVIYQEIEAEAEARGELGGETRGKEIGIQEGEQRGLEKERSLIFRLLTRRVGSIAPQQETQIRSLSLTQLEDLGEALLDFAQPSDLDKWLQSHQ